MRRFIPLAIILGSLACSGNDRPAQTTTAADVIAGKAEAFERFESKGGSFTVDLPPVWRGSYSVLEGPDSSAGARFRVQFMFRPDPAWKVEPQTLIVVRIFSKAAWDKVMARPGQPVAARITERGDDVFALSLPEVNPYKPGTPEAKRYDDLVLSVVQDKAGLRLTPK
jgi:hypothetical protein